ncbi:MAG TPA: sulfurtransferase FdhD, partial [Colwellia sp.]|nr:sulfurtransferase FdhD [Colwellia sp.]
MHNLAIEHLSPTLTITESSEQKLHQAELLEVAVAISINGISQAVMMASPEHLKDFALGFALSEGLINSSSDVLNIVVHSHECGWQVDLQVLARVQNQLKQRRRTMAGPSGCGLCGLDSIEAAMLIALPQESATKSFELPSEAIIIQARDNLPALLKSAGGKRGNHCAAFFDLSANMLAFREDVGRHSALDKLIGCLSN